MFDNILAIVEAQHGRTSLDGAIEDQLDRALENIINSTDDPEIKGFIKGIYCAFVNMTVNMAFWEDIADMIASADSYLWSELW